MKAADTIIRKNAEWLLAATQYEDGKPQERHQAAFDRLTAALDSLVEVAEAARAFAGQPGVRLAPEFEAAWLRLRHALETLEGEPK